MARKTWIGTGAQGHRPIAKLDDLASNVFSKQDWEG